MNNIWAYDLVPTVEVIEAIIQGARRFNDYPTAVRVLEGLKFKVQKKEQYDAYLQELRPMLDDLGALVLHSCYYACPYITLSLTICWALHLICKQESRPRRSSSARRPARFTGDRPLGEKVD